MLKIPSFQQLVRGFISVIQRFPLVMVISLIGTVGFMLLIEVTYDHSNGAWLRELYTRIILTSILGLTLLLSTTLFTEQQQFSKAKSWLLQLAAVVVLVGLYFFLHPIDFVTNAFRFGFLVVAFHLLVSFTPFLHKSSVDGFWEYNKQLFLRILLSALYSTVLFAGLCIAIVSTNELFNLNLDGEIYGHLAAVVYGLFNTAFFLAGVPADWKSQETTHTYPKGLKIFTQFVLIPLATVYLAILLAYECKVILEWSLPKGLVSSLVLGYAVYGILSILLVYPVRHDSENRWIRTFSRLFYLLLIPLIALLVLAVYWRIHEYGITESRYILLVLSFWLMGVTAYFLISKAQNIKVIPISLCIVALFCTWGPQSASSLSIRSQTNQLINLFEKNNAFNNRQFSPLPDTVSGDVSNRARDIVYYITEREGLKPFKPYLTVNFDSLETLPAKNSYQRNSRYTQKLDSLLGIRYGRSYYQYHNAYAGNDTINIQGYDAFRNIAYHQYDDSLDVKWIADKKVLRVNYEAEFLLGDLFKRIEENEKFTRLKNLHVKTETSEVVYLLMFKHISFSEKSGEVLLENFDGVLLIDYKATLQKP